MLYFEKNMIEKNQTLIFIFLPKFLPNQMHSLVFFLKKNNFSIERITKKTNHKVFNSFLRNSNFLLKSNSEIERNQLNLVLDFLNQSAVINGVFFQNQIWNMDRFLKTQNLSLFRSWKQKFTIQL